MAHQDGADKGASGIARVGKRKWGYDPDQVDAFLDRAHALYESEDAHLTQQDIQNVSFDLSKGGYDITQVDAALSRLEQAVVDKQTTRRLPSTVVWRGKPRPKSCTVRYVSTPTAARGAIRART